MLYTPQYDKIERAKPLYTQGVSPITINLLRRSTMTEKIISQCKVEGCETSSHYLQKGKRGYCNRHYLRIHRNGHLNISRQSCEGTLEERFWARINKNGPTQPHMVSACWEWTAGCTAYGYGTISANGHKWLTHRLAWELAHNAVPQQCILHECDNPKCVNPAHLREGTQQENRQDSIDRNRHNWGEKNGQAKLTAKQVQDIRQYLAQGMSCTDIATLYDVGMSNISAIKTGKSWKQLI